jgi:(hydroxyamino)benzene mutase
VETQIRTRQLLRHGLALVLCGLVWGIIVPHTPFPRLALTAHIQFMVNGMLLMLMAVLLLTLAHKVGPRSLLVMLVSAWLTWAMAASEVANAWWGTREILPIAAQQAQASGASSWQESVVSIAHIASGFALILSWVLLTLGLWSAKHGQEPAQRTR